MMPIKSATDIQERSAYKSLRNLLINYRFRPGEQLYPGRIAESLQMSSTPVREMLHRMSAENLALLVPHKGFFAKTLLEREMRELFDIIYGLLTHVVRTCHDSIAVKLVDVPSEHILWSGTAISLDDPEAVALAVENVLRSVIELSGNECALNAMSNWLDRTHYIRCLSKERRKQANRIIDQLHDIIDDLRMNNHKRAIKHLSLQHSSLMTNLAELVREGIVRSHAQSLDQALSHIERDRIVASAPSNCREQ